ncbi:MAG: polysaccharide biosynthesis tyrosine autokinase [Thermodesulfovibrionales bacterium]
MRKNSSKGLVKREETKDIGTILIEAGKLTPSDLEKIIEFQKRYNVLFGEAAVKLRYLEEEDVTWALAVQFSYPYLKNGENTISKEVIAFNNPFSPQVETIRTIRSEMVLSGVGSKIKTIAVVSPNDGEGKTFVSSNLAAVFAQLGSKTMLIDINFRRPRIHEIFNLKNNCGLSSLIIKRADLNQAVQFRLIPSLHIMPSGPKPPNPVELLGWQETKEVVSYMKNLYDVVIIDTPSFLKSGDALLISNLSDAVIIVVAKGYTKIDSFGQVKKQLDSAGVRIIGSLINEIGKNKTKISNHFRGFRVRKYK